MDGGLRIVPISRADVDAVFKLQCEFETYLQGLTGKRRSTDMAERNRRFLRDGFGNDPAFKCLIAKRDNDVLDYICYHFG